MFTTHVGGVRDARMVSIYMELLLGLQEGDVQQKHMTCMHQHRRHAMAVQI